MFDICQIRNILEKAFNIFKAQYLFDGKLLQPSDSSAMFLIMEQGSKLDGKSTTDCCQQSSINVSRKSRNQA